MGRLTNLKPQLATLRPSIAYMPQGEKERDRSRSDLGWRKWYNTTRWRKLRWSVLVRDGFTCQRCRKLEGNTSQLVANHRNPHHGNELLFWDETNIEAVCKPCHDGVIQREEKCGAPSGAASHPSWFRKSYIPLTIVAGPPGSGKSAYVKKHAQPSDCIICYDQIATAMYGREGQGRTQARLRFDQRAQVLRARNEALSDLMRKKSALQWKRAWLIVSEPEAHHRQWWADVVGASVIVLPVSPDECKRRIQQDTSHGDQRGEGAIAFVDDWWRLYTPAQCDEIA